MSWRSLLKILRGKKLVRGKVIALIADNLRDAKQRLLDFIFVRLALRLFKKKIVVGIGEHLALKKRALIYFKTDPLFSRRLRDAFVHTNNSEIMTMIEIFNRLGFVVDLVDRDVSWSEIEPLLANEYDIYLANAAGNSAPIHSRINAAIVARHRVFFAAGPEPETCNRLTETRHADFDMRTGAKCVRRRLVKGDELALRFERMDVIYYVGNRFSEETYIKYGLPSFRIYPSTSPQIRFDASVVGKKKSHHFMYFGGNGLICKGLDLVLEAFDGMKGVKLDVCGPSNEADFWLHYKPLLARNPHIRYHGFVQAGGVVFSEITSTAAFQIFPGSAEGCATSVVTCMRRGVIPVTTYETGVDIGEHGITIEEPSVELIRSLVASLRKMPSSEVRRRAVDTYLASMDYTLERFALSFESALIKTLQIKDAL